MSSSTSHEVFVAALQERFDEFKKNVDQLIEALSAGSLEGKCLAATKLSQSADDIKRMLVEKDQPRWLLHIIRSLNSNRGNLEISRQCFDLTKSIATVYKSIQDHRWTFVSNGLDGIDFDAIFEACRSESRIPELFDKLVASLDELIATSEIDSVRVIQALKKLSETLRKNRKGSYFSTLASWDAVAGVLKKWVWVELEKLPLLGGLVTALLETLEETDAEMLKLHAAMQAEVNKQIAAEFAMLSYQTRYVGESASVLGIGLASDETLSQE